MAIGGFKFFYLATKVAKFFKGRNEFNVLWEMSTKKMDISYSRG
jgi:hypothetical protein